MNCVEFEGLLFQGLERPLAIEDVERMQAHLPTCDNCRSLNRLVRGDDDHGVIELPIDFAAGVVARTSGRPCERAQSLLVAPEDSVPGDNWLVSRHLESCPDCSAVARALARLQLDLPMLAEADPGQGFVSVVIAATLGTSGGPKESPRPGRYRFIERLIRRPRIALEGAYSIAMLVLMVFGLTSLSFSELPVRAAGDAWRSVADTARTAAAGVSDLGAGTIVLADRVAESASADAVERGATAFNSARDFARTGWDRLVAANVKEIRSWWNENAAGAVEPDTSNPASR